MNRATGVLLCCASAAMIGMNITTTGVLFRNALMIMIKRKIAAVIMIGRLS